ncbi:hypothetical protein RZS08_35690, partial [Arthrospira platensis SPKY1]|nr:hypothetical protein [Arthrospira platensis SPKY1]
PETEPYRPIKKRLASEFFTLIAHNTFVISVQILSLFKKNAMSQFELIEVNTPQLEKSWLDFPSKLYKNDPNYVRPLDMDVQKLFNVESNKKLRKGEAIRWLLLDKTSKKLAGRIA